MQELVDDGMDDLLNLLGILIGQSFYHNDSTFYVSFFLQEILAEKKNFIVLVLEVQS
jgi:hypothetical protein